MDKKTEWCRSTHGGAGYAPGSYWDGDVIICGWCGARIENPAPTGSYVEYYTFWESPLKWLRREVKSRQYNYGDAVQGEKGKRWLGRRVV